MIDFWGTEIHIVIIVFNQLFEHLFFGSLLRNRHIALSYQLSQDILLGFMIFFEHALVKSGAFVTSSCWIGLLWKLWAMMDYVFVSPEDKWVLVSKQLLTVFSSPHGLCLLFVASVVVGDLIKLLLQLQTKWVHLLKAHFLLLLLAEVVVDIEIFILNIFFLVWHKAIKISLVKSRF